ncbi:DNA/RNA non-specific endonuclease [Tenacibaculum amylolyticum]|uniref:DNA/RNA non-specific endonuclease n=1 Tax=Tenacibaculum amylolyticum TaxID=104269 RepID=UPI003892D322
MKNRNKLIAAILLVAILTLNHYLDTTNDDNSTGIPETLPSKKKTATFNYLPSSTTQQIVKHNYYALSYNEKHEQAEWVAYTLDKDDIVNTNFKRPFFIKDPKVKTTSADWKNFKKSGYDKGHLCPAGDRRFSKAAFNETFYTSNVTPQKHNFNAGIWNKLEQKVRYWAKKYDHLYVVTGGVLTDAKYTTIGKENVSVPNSFFKVILDYTQPEIKAIAFLIPHKETDKPLHDFVISIDKLEEITNIDFFPELPDSIENKLEAATDYKNWAFGKGL